MSNTQATTTVRKMYGKALSEFGPNVPAVLEVPYTYAELAQGEDVPEDEALTEEDILSVINGRRQAAARASAVAAALKEYGISAPALTDAEKAFNGIVKSLKLVGMPDAEATAMAETILAGKK